MEYTVTIFGLGAHGSRPDLGRNPVDCFAAAYGALQTIGCTISDVDGGTAGNIIADKLIFRCTCQSKEALERILTHTAAAYNCTAEIA